MDANVSAYAVGPYMLKEATYQMEQVGSTLVWPVINAEATSFEVLGRMLELQAQEGVRRFLKDNEWQGMIPVAGREPEIEFTINTRPQWKRTLIGYGALQEVRYRLTTKAEMGIRFVQWAWKDVRPEHQEWIRNVAVPSDRREVSVIQGWPKRFPGADPMYIPI